MRIALASLVAVFVLTGFSAAAPRPFEVTKLPEPRWSRTGPVPRGDANVKLVLVSYLYLLDRRTGGVLQRLRVPTAPEYLIRRGRTLFVRTYDRDLVVRLSESA